MIPFVALDVLKVLHEQALEGVAALALPGDGVP